MNSVGNKSRTSLLMKRSEIQESPFKYEIPACAGMTIKMIIHPLKEDRRFWGVLGLCYSRGMFKINRTS